MKNILLRMSLHTLIKKQRRMKSITYSRKKMLLKKEKFQIFLIKSGSNQKAIFQEH